jgi:ABC-type transporter Mla maintaining outer membrane lipid asymmetry permease subunit MlaE
MKKVIALTAIVALTACNNGTSTKSTSDSTKVDSSKTVVDSVKVDSTKK